MNDGGQFDLNRQNLNVYSLNGGCGGASIFDSNETCATLVVGDRRWTSPAIWRTAQAPWDWTWLVDR